jgi:hypothetical protein
MSPKFAWSQQREDAAQLVADDRLSNDAIAAQVGISAKQLERWKLNPEFAARVDKHIALWRERVRRQGLALKERRIESLIADFSSTDVILAERGAQNEQAVSERDPYAGGSRTGFITRDFKGKDADTPVYSFDAALMRERRELRRQIAQELGEWADERRLNLTLPPVKTARDITDALSVILRAAASGEITASEGQSLAGLLDAARRCFETDHLEARIHELERSNSANGRPE